MAWRRKKSGTAPCSRLPSSLATDINDSIRDLRIEALSRKEDTAHAIKTEPLQDKIFAPETIPWKCTAPSHAARDASGLRLELRRRLKRRVPDRHEIELESSKDRIAIHGLRILKHLHFFCLAVSLHLS